MVPRMKVGGWCGVVAGVGLAIETSLWLASGWDPRTFSDPAAAIALLSQHGIVLRWAVAAGFTNLVFLVMLVAALGGRLWRRTPSLAAATLWLGMIGITSHLLVPLSHWYGVPGFLDASMRDPQAARGAWTAFYLVGHEAAGGAGSLFLGLSMFCAGWAIVAEHELPRLVGWIGLLAGATTVVTLFAADTPISTLSGAAFMPSLLLTIVFRIGAGAALIWASAEGAPENAAELQRAF